MTVGRVVRLTDRRCVVAQVLLASTMRTRLIGLLGHSTLADGIGLWLQPGGSIHTLGMRFAIDAVFLDAQGAVLRIDADIPARRVRLAPRTTRSVLEVAAGYAERAEIYQGMRLGFDEG